ncbi:MAG: hypothetical protein JST55_14825 [Bacteroidetes bacterium]|nr:hypothetical protein [Bacteroidota bacterium]
MTPIKSALLVFALLFSLPSINYSQSYPNTLNTRPVVSVSAGISAFNYPSNYIDMYKPSYAASLQFEHPVSNFISVGIEANLSTFSLADNTLPSNSAALQHLSLFGFNFFGKIQPEQISIGKFHPFVKGGFGAHLRSGKPETGFPYPRYVRINSGGLVYTFGPGVTYNLNKTNFVFIESALRINKSSSPDINYNTLNFALGFSHQF